MADDDKGTKKDTPTGPSKFPDLKEIGGMASKLFGDVKSSITEIVADYKKKRPKQDKPKEEKATKADEAPKAKAPNAEEKPEAPSKAPENKENKSDDAS